MLTTQDIVKAFINSKHGWAVADQFESIFEDCSEDNLAKQNLNALRYIKESLTSLIRSEILNEDATDELASLAGELVGYFEEIGA